MKELVEQFLTFETENRLFEAQLGGLKFWQFIRFDAFNKIVSSKYNRPTTRENYFKAGFDVHIKGLKNFAMALIRNCFNSWERTDLFVLSNPRRILIGKWYYDIYTDFLIEETSYRCQSAETFFKLFHLRPARTKNLFYLDHLEYPARVLSFIRRAKLNPEELAFLNRLEENIRTTFGISGLTLAEDLNHILVRYHFLYPRLKKMIGKMQPRGIIETFGYELIRQIVTKIAGECRVPVIELQHGTMGHYHIAYNIINGEAPETFPDYIFVWGEFWKNQTRFPIDSSRVVATGFPYFEKQVQKISSYKKEGTVLFISQPTIGDQLGRIAGELARRQSDYRIIYKLHPGEVITARRRYKSLYENPTIEVVENSARKIYDLFAECEYQVGVYSTAIIEGIGFGLETVVVRLPGWEYLESLQGNPRVRFVDTVDQLVAALEDKRKTESTETLRSYFWEPQALPKMLHELNKIIKRGEVES